MQYLLLIYNNENDYDRINESERQKILGEYLEFRKDIATSGQYVGSNRLRPVSQARTVRIRDGKKMVTDGPFAETKEQLGGYFLVEARDADEATAIAARIPGARYGSIEVRPIWPTPQNP